MKTLLINLDNLKKLDILYEHYIVAQLIFEGKLNEVVKENTDNVYIKNCLISLQDLGYIKIISLGEFDVEPRELLVNLFTSVSKNKEAVEVLTYFNTKLKAKNPNLKGFSLTSASNLRHVNGRLAQGYSVQDLKNVIDTMIKEWWNSKMREYLRPETLFNETKFQTYINKVGADKGNTFNTIEMC